MSYYNTGNLVPSTDPRDLDDNATNFDLLLLSPLPSVPDRLGVPRKTWAKMEQDAAALVSPNVAALAALTAAANLGVFFNTGAPGVTMGTYSLTSFSRGLLGSVDGPAFRTAIGAVGTADNITGSAAKLTTPRTLSTTGDASWSVSFDGSANATAALALSATGVTAGTYGSVTVDAKGRVTAATTLTPIANGGTGATSMGAGAVGTVSQSGGIPTGKIIEQGSNANGEYVKWADGRLECTKYIASESVALTTASGQLFTGVPAAWTFPIPFVGALPVLTGHCHDVAGTIMWLGVRGGGFQSLTNGAYRILSTLSVTSTAIIAYRAVGRWF